MLITGRRLAGFAGDRYIAAFGRCGGSVRYTTRCEGEVMSLGEKFVKWKALPMPAKAGGYAVEQSEKNS